MTLFHIFNSGNIFIEQIHIANWLYFRLFLYLKIFNFWIFSFWIWEKEKNTCNKTSLSLLLISISISVSISFPNVLSDWHFCIYLAKKKNSHDTRSRWILSWKLLMKEIASIYFFFVGVEWRKCSHLYVGTRNLYQTEQDRYGIKLSIWNGLNWQAKHC